MALKKFSELGHVHRTEPCEEYPGIWIVHIPKHISFEGKEFDSYEQTFSSCEDAKFHARTVMYNLEQLRMEFNPVEITVSWKCSDNDPRIGEVWFTPYYMHGRFNAFGDYRET